MFLTKCKLLDLNHSICFRIIAFVKRMIWRIFFKWKELRSFLIKCLLGRLSNCGNHEFRNLLRQHKDEPRRCLPIFVSSSPLPVSTQALQVLVGGAARCEIVRQVRFSNFFTVGHDLGAQQLLVRLLIVTCHITYLYLLQLLDKGLVNYQLKDICNL